MRMSGPQRLSSRNLTSTAAPPHTAEDRPVMRSGVFGHNVEPSSCRRRASMLTCLVEEPRVCALQLSYALYSKQDV